MGTEDLHHKRKQQTRDTLQRQISSREPYDVVLIICEGGKTEPNYLGSLCASLKLKTANIQIQGKGADPLTLVEYAIEASKKNDHDRIYCFFDKDQHAHYDAAIKKIHSLRENKKNAIPIYAITSVPSFEYWILLHFEDTRRPYEDSKQLLNELKKYIKDYQKDSEDIFEKNELLFTNSH